MLPSIPEIELVKGHFVSEAGRHTTHNLSWLWRLVAWWQVVLIHKMEDISSYIPLKAYFFDDKTLLLLALCIPTLFLFGV